MIRMIFLFVYRLAWVLFLPLLLIYLFKRGRRDALYSQNLLERFAIYNRPMPQDAIWVTLDIMWTYRHFFPRLSAQDWSNLGG